MKPPGVSDCTRIPEPVDPPYERALFSTILSPMGGDESPCETARNQGLLGEHNFGGFQPVYRTLWRNV